MSAPNKLPRHGSTDQASPTENEYTHDLSLLWKPAQRHVPHRDHGTRSLRANIAVQRVRREKA